MTLSTAPPSLSATAGHAERAAASIIGSRVFVWVFLSAVLARSSRAVGLWQEAGANDGFVWFPLGLAADVLIALLVVALVRPVALRRPRVGIAWALFLGLAHIGWLGLNLVSFTLTQAPITFQRARGDEGVALDAHALLRFEDVVPAIGFAVLALIALPVAWRVGHVALRAIGVRPRVIVIAIAFAAYVGDAFVLRESNFGVADHPVFTLASSFAHSVFGERRRPSLKVRARADHDALLVARTPAAESAPPLRQRAEQKNVIVFFAEGVSREHTSLAGASTTPNLARRAAESGLELTRYHSPYHKSIAAIFSLVCSEYPPPKGTNIVEVNPRIDCGEMSTVLHGHGFRTGLFHGGDFGFYDKLMLLGMRHWDVAEDARVMSDPLTYDENEWGIDDRAAVDHLLAWIDTVPTGERFAALYIPITAHWPYWIPSDVEPQLPPISSKNKFLNAVHFLDIVFEKLMVGLEERGLADDTAVIYVADHGETVGERPRASAGRRLAYEPSLHVPFVVLAPGMWPPGSKSDRLGSHVDLLPTIMDLLALPPDERHRGTSLLFPDREPSRIFIGASNGPRLIGWLDGDQKFTLNQVTGVREAYDLARDPDERDNIIDELPPENVERLEQDALAFADAHQAYLKGAKKVDDELDIEGLFLDAVEVRVVRDDVTTVCPRSADPLDAQRVCPGEEGVFEGRQRTSAGGMRHDCIVVKPPRNGVLELEVRDQPWLPLITRVRLAQTKVRRETGASSLPLDVFSDGVHEGSRTLASEASVRVTFASPRSSLVVRLGGEGETSRDICLTLSERGWRNRPLRVAAPSTGGASDQGSDDAQ